jgi:hypothetical protein
LKGEEIAARIYVVDSSDVPALKKILEYDPYLDPNIIPKTPKEWDNPEYIKNHPEIAQEVENKKKQAEEAMNKLRDDKEANIIFARKDYLMKDGITIGLDSGKCYLYLSADDSFLDAAESKLKKSISSIKRAPSDIEKQIIDTVERERQSADEGLGFIFG